MVVLLSEAAEFVEFVIQGPRGWTAGFLEGRLQSDGFAGRVFDAEVEGFDVATLRERWVDRILRQSTTEHILVSSQAAARVRTALAGASERITLIAERNWDSAGFDFCFQIFSPKDAARIRAYFEPLPPGLRPRDDFRIEEIVREGSRGIEMLTPSHGWELRGEGRVEGTIDAILELLRRCRNEELVKVRNAQLLHGDATSGPRGAR